MKIKLHNMSLRYDKKKFGERLTELRKKRWVQYKSNINKKNNPYEKYACCKTQDSLANALGVERRTIGKWELGASFPALDTAAELCDLLGCNVDYLLGAESTEGFSPVVIASHFSGISEDIITYATENSDFRDCLNYFMHPDNCSLLFNSISLTAWKEYLSEHEFDLIRDPLKSFIEDIFHQYQAFTPFSKYGLESYREYVRHSIPVDKISFCSRKADERISVNSCLPDSVVKGLSLSSKNKNSYDSFIDYIVNCSFETLNTKALLEIKKNELGKSFVKLFEGYLSE